MWGRSIGIKKAACSGLLAASIAEPIFAVKAA